LLAAGGAPRAQGGVPPIDPTVTFILPNWGSFFSATDAEFAVEAAELKARIPEGRRVRVGFTPYISVGMAAADPSDTAAIRAAIAPAIARMDTAIARARANGLALGITFFTAIRAAYDEAQFAFEREDRRNAQWHADHAIAGGWVTLSRYARRQRAVEEAHLRELGAAIAARMAAYPDTFVAASGDGEVELSGDPADEQGRAIREGPLADYSPFAVAEFRDWLRGTGLYAPGQPFAGEAYAQAARYAGAGGLGQLNIDAGTSFSTWTLRYHEWSLADNPFADAGAIPAAQYEQPGWTPPDAGEGFFDPPRQQISGHPWWVLWDQFRQTMVWRYNRNLARWITTSPDPLSGATVPPDRWFTDQIPADYLFGHTPQNPDRRLVTSASPWWTADVSPYGSIGITSFNANLGNGIVAPTLANVAPHIAARGVRWGIFEWNPVAPSSADVDIYPEAYLEIYRADMRLVEQYKPSILVPHVWNHPDFRIKDSGFEVALRELAGRLNTPPLTASPASIEIGAVSGGAATPPQRVRFSGFPGESPTVGAADHSPLVTVTLAPDGRSMTVALANTNVPPGMYAADVTVTPAAAGYSARTIPVTVRISPPGATAAPVGSFDTPVAGAVVSGELPVTGWAVDDIGIRQVQIYRSPLPGEPTQPNGLVLVGDATIVEGARPDVAAVYPEKPLNGAAGWGYMLLTNMLPGQGNGPFTLHAIARDYDGRETSLGSRAIEARNSTATLPFGTIDTPRQGETVSGTIVNFGWALTPQPNVIPFDGSTIGVYVDGVLVGRPVFNNYREDIATLFPGYANSNGAVGYFMLDTTTLSNGVHTIAWGVIDSAGNAQGVGSRFFTVAN
jgi:hypothetical protein